MNLMEKQLHKQFIAIKVFSNTTWAKEKVLNDNDLFEKKKKKRSNARF